MLIKKRTIYLMIALAIVFVGGFFAYPLLTQNTRSPTGSAVSVKAVSAEEIYSMFLCPCCGQILDKNNICCGMAEEMIGFIDSQIATGFSKNDVIIKTVEKYGINSIIESKRDDVKAELAKRNPDLFPTEEISFKSAVGKKAPDFILESIDDKTVKLSDYRGKNIVLFFNEGGMCYPACWDQMGELGNDERFSTNDTVTFSIVVDTKSEWQKITKEVPKLAKAKLLFDTTRAVSSAYDVLSLPSSMHPGSYPGHTYFIIDKEGVIRYAFDDPRMAIWNDKLVDEIEKLG